MLEWPRDAITIVVGSLVVPFLAAVGVGAGLQLTGVV